jgi:hyperosmotically inducible protein
MNRFAGLPFLAAAALVAAIGASGCSKPPEVVVPTPTSTAGSGNPSDADVTEHVRTALNQHPSLKGFDIKVVTLKGDVRLAGMLDSQTQIDDAIKVARAADGAHTIHNELTLKK